MNRFIYWGPREAFQNEYNIKNNIVYFSELVQKVQKEEKTFEIKGVNQETSNNIGKIENLIITTDEFSTVNEWVLYNLDAFINRFNIENVYFQNPPNQVYNRISKLDNCKETKYEYTKINTELVKEISNEFSNVIIGQEKSKEQLVNLLYAATFNFFDNKPLILMFYGPSGVGKTETAKFISSKLGGDILRKQFSMFQNNEFVNYLFGTKHNEGSFAKDLLDRETNVILLDEFDKANNLFFSAFYQLFDEGIFEDRNYLVELKDSIIICTSNYETTEEIKEKLGLPIYNRFDGFIRFENFDSMSSSKVIEIYFNKYLKCLDNKQQKLIKDKKVEELLIHNSSKFKNAREIDKIVRDVIISVLASKYLKGREDNKK